VKCHRPTGHPVFSKRIRFRLGYKKHDSKVTFWTYGKGPTRFFSHPRHRPRLNAGHLDTLTIPQPHRPKALFGKASHVFVYCHYLLHNHELPTAHFCLSLGLCIGCYSRHSSRSGLYVATCHVAPSRQAFGTTVCSRTCTQQATANSMEEASALCKRSNSHVCGRTNSNCCYRSRYQGRNAKLCK
jgi:hypothetical protein